MAVSSVYCPGGGFLHNSTRPHPNNVWSIRNIWKVDKSRNQSVVLLFNSFHLRLAVLESHPTDHPFPPACLLASGRLSQVHTPLACCEPAPCYSCHLSNRVLFCIHLNAATPNEPVHSQIIYNCWKTSVRATGMLAPIPLCDMQERCCFRGPKHTGSRSKMEDRRNIKNKQKWHLKPERCKRRRKTEALHPTLQILPLENDYYKKL